MINTVTVAGFLGQDPHLKYTQTNIPVCSFSVCWSNRRQKKGGGEVEDKAWVDVDCFYESAENVAQYARQGSRVVVSGRLITQSWEGNDGKKHSKLVLQAETVGLVPKREQRQQAPYDSPAGARAASAPRDVNTGQPDPEAPTGDSVPF
jgi:single-strand DNA-binding protein